MREAATSTMTLDELREEVAALTARVDAQADELARLREDADARKEVLDLEGAARLLGVSTKTIQRRLAEGRIPHFRVGGDKGVRIERAELLKAARAGFPKMHAGRSRLHSRAHFPGSVSA